MDPITGISHAAREGFGFLKTAANKIWADKNVKIETKADLEKFLGELENEMYSQGYELAKAGAAVVLAEAKSEDKWTRRWRPVLMYVCIYTIFIAIPVPLTWNHLLMPLLGPIFGMLDIVLQPIILDLEHIPSQIWNIILAGIAGYAPFRSLIDKKEQERTKRAQIELEKERIKNAR